MKLFNSILAGMALLVTASCTDLDENVYSEVVSKNFYSNKDEVISAYLVPYAQLAKSITQYTQAVGFVSDEYLIPLRGIHHYGGGSYRLLHWHKWTADEYWTRRPWENMYQGIGFCNNLLADLEKLPLESYGFSGDEVRTMFAEIKAMRALFYFYLLDLYGNVPIVTSLSEENPTNTPRAEVFAWVEAELLGSINDLLDRGAPNAYGRFTQQAGWTLLAKLYLNAEVYTGQARWEDCAMACDKVTGVTLDDHWQAPFVPDNHLSKENILVVPFDEINVRGNELLARSLHYEHQKKYQFTQKPWNAASTTEDFYNKFDETDKRIAQWLVGPQTYDSLGVTKPILGTEERKGQPLVITPKVTSMVASAEDEGARNIKYKPEIGANPAHMNNDFVIFRYADILLMKAESLLRTGKANEATDLVNRVRARAFDEGNPLRTYAPGELTMDEFLDEKGREFVWEGWRRNDLIRFGKFNDAWWDKEPSEAFRKLFPIPNTALSVNNNLKQNEGYH